MRKRMASDRHFVNAQVDPVLGTLLERLYIAQPPRPVPFMLRELRGEPHPPARRAPVNSHPRKALLARLERVVRRLLHNAIHGKGADDYRHTAGGI